MNDVIQKLEGIYWGAAHAEEQIVKARRDIVVLESMGEELLWCNFYHKEHFPDGVDTTLRCSLPASKVITEARIKLAEMEENHAKRPNALRKIEQLIEELS